MKSVLKILKALLGAAPGLSAGDAASKSARTTTDISFGVIADIHHSLRPHDYPNIGDHSARINAFIAAVESQGADFLVALGDNVHNFTRVEDFLTASDVLDNTVDFVRYFSASRVPVYPVLGNHDIVPAEKADVIALLNNPAAGVYLPSNYHYFDYPARGWRFIVLDAQYELDGNDIGSGSSDYGAGYIPPVEQDGLSATLAEAKSLGYRAMVFTHQRLEVTGDAGTANSSEVLAIIEQSGIVPLVLQGHYHENVHIVHNGVHYLTFYTPATRDDGRDPTDDWALVEIKHNGDIVITGHGDIADVYLPAASLYPMQDRRKARKTVDSPLVFHHTK